MESIYQLYTGLGCGIFLLILGFVFYKFPPKKINHIYGYRTTRSMKSQDTWDSANEFSSKWMMRFGVLVMLVSGALYVLLPEHNALISVVAMTLLVVLILPITEEHLKRHYTKSGAPKSIVEEFDLPETGVARGEEE